MREEVSDEIARNVLSDEMVAKVFDTAWDHQFDKDRQACVNRCRDIVQIEIDSQFEGAANADR